MTVNAGSALQNLFDLAQRNALVTGGGRGLGKAMALGLAQHGANVALVDVDLATAQHTSREIEALGVRSLALQGDVTKEEDAVRTVAEVVDSWEHLDILVNNAGISIQVPAEETSLADLKHLYDIDVFGTFTFAK